MQAIAINPGQVSSNPNLETSADLKIQKTSLGSNKNTETESSERNSNAIPDTSNKTKINFEAKFPFYKLYKDCKENSTCFEGGVIQLIDNMDNKSIPIYQDIILLEKTSDESPSGSDPSETLMKRFDRFLRDHSIRVRIPNLRSEEQQSPQEKENYAEFPLRALATTDASEDRRHTCSTTPPTPEELALKCMSAIDLAYIKTGICRCQGHGERGRRREEDETEETGLAVTYIYGTHDLLAYAIIIRSTFTLKLQRLSGWNVCVVGVWFSGLERIIL
ncbi:hypothetical protein C0J52_16938 [Blattella germanica]|nr:hypothetical protein C0J52_16938 [Blattella germanica]